MQIEVNNSRLNNVLLNYISKVNISGKNNSYKDLKKQNNKHLFDFKKGKPEILEPIYN